MVQRLYAFGFNSLYQCLEPDIKTGIGLLREVNDTKKGVIMGANATWSLSYAWDSLNRVFLWGFLGGLFLGCNYTKASFNFNKIGRLQTHGESTKLEKLYIIDLETLKKEDVSYAIYALDSTKTLWKLKPRLRSNFYLLGNTLDADEFFEFSQIPINSKNDTIRDIAATKDRCVILMNSGSIYEITHPGTNYPKLLSSPPMVTICSGSTHFLSIDINGLVYSWGSHNLRGELGIGEGRVGMCNEPICVTSLNGLRALKVCAGPQHSLVLTDDGDLYGFGSDYYSQLGLMFTPNDSHIPSTTTQRYHYIPTLIDTMDLETPSDILLACGAHHSLCASSKRLFSTGFNKYNQVSPRDAQNEPFSWREIDVRFTFEGNFEKIDLITAGSWHSLICIST